MQDFQVDCDWLSQHLNDDNLIVLDASMADPVNKQTVAEGVIPGAIRFDFSHHVVDENSAQSNTMPSSEVFQQKVRELGINQTSFLVVYDNAGLFSAARAWYMFKVMGFDNVAILKGGLPSWVKHGFDVSSEHASAKATGDFVAKPVKQGFADKRQVLDAINDPDVVIVDARGYGRFSGQEAEPRQGMRSGHIPSSLNLHYANLVSQGSLLDKAALCDIFEELTPKPEHFIFSCGSGVTACILALAAEIAGFTSYQVYDGSWSEWGKDNLLPIDTVKN